MQTVANILPEQHNLIRGNYYRAQIPELWKNNPDRNYNYIVLSLKKAREMKKKKRVAIWGSAILRSQHRH